MCNPQARDITHRASTLLQVGQTGFISEGRQDCIVEPAQTNCELWKQNSIIEFYYDAGIQPNPCTCGRILPWLNIVREPHHVLLHFHTRGKNNLQSPAHINLWGLAFQANKRSNGPLSACAADISHNDDSHYSMHPTKFNNNLTFFYCSCFYDNASPCCNFEAW